jgi:hypothetical protein
MKKYINQYKIGFSLFGLIAFILQEIPYLPWLFWPPVDNPLANNDPANIFLGILEQVGGILTVALLILLLNKSVIRPNFGNKYFIFAFICLVFYYVCWICYFAGITNGWLIVIGLSAIVPLYYFFIALWNKNIFAVIFSILFFIGHTVSNIINYL